MTNFKSGSGNLDFDGDGDEEDGTESPPPASTSAGDDESKRAEPAAEGAGDSVGQSNGDTVDDGPAASTHGDDETYPYFVRRNNVGDERDTRLEIHVRDKVADGEAKFRHALAAELDASDVSKTDAREFALLAAFRHPERVAELMREEGFDSLG